MKQLFTLFLLILLSCSMNDTKTIETIKQDPFEIDAIKKMLTSQQECWNNGDIDGFMQGYWNSEKLIFTSLSHKPAYGWKNTLERYKNSYPTKESMGEFKFDIYDEKLTSKRTAILNGKWKLIRINDNPKGSFTYIFKKIENNWLIISDYTTEEYYPS